MKTKTLKRDAEAKRCYIRLLNAASNAIVNLKKFICAHPLLVLTFFMVATSVFVFFQFLFQKQIFMYSDVGADTKNIYYPFFLSLERKLSTGDFSMWDFTHGLGTNILTRQADVGNIFTWITCVLGAGGIKYALVFVYILKIFLSGYICYYYLDTFKFSTVSKVVLAYVYAFNGFTMLWGQHYFFGTASLYIVLMLFAIEKSFQTKKGYLLVIVSTFIVACNTYYLAYMVLLVAAVYALFRLFAMYSFKEMGQAFKRIGGLLGAVLVGACMAAFLFLPAVTIVLDTSARISGEMSLFDKLLSYMTASYDEATMEGIVSRFFSNNLLGTNDYTGPLNYYEMPQWFFTSFTVFFSFIFISEIFFNKEEKLKIKILKFIGVALVIFLAFHPLLSVVLNGFVGHFFRYTYLIMPILAVCFADVLDKIVYRRLAYGKLQIFGAAVFSVVALSAILFLTNTASRMGEFLGYIYLIMTVVLALLAVILQDSKISLVQRTICIMCVAATMVANVSVESFVTTNVRTLTSEVNGKIYMTSGNDEVKEALAFIDQNDPSFHRVEKTFQDIAFLNDSLMQGYYGVSVYNSVVNKDIIEFVKHVCPDFKITSVDGYYDFREIYNDVDIVSLLGIKYILTTEHINDVPEYSYITSFGSLHIYENTATDGVGKFYSNAIDLEDYIRLEESSKEGLISDTLIIDGLGDMVSDDTEAGESTVSFQRPTNSSCVVGTVDAKQDGWVFLSIPCEKGWKAYVDGVETEILQADIAFSAIKVDEGEHHIVLQYNTPMLKEGILVSCVGGMCFVLWCVILLISARKKERTKL